MAKPPPYPPKSSGRTMAGPKKKGLKHPSFAGSDTEPYNVRPQKPKATSIKKMMAVARGKKVDPTDYVRPPSRITKPFKGPFRGGPSKIIKPYKGPRIKRDDDLRNMLPRQRPKPSKPRGNPNAKYRIVPAKKKK